MQNHHVAGHEKLQLNYFLAESSLSEMKKLKYIADINTTKKNGNKFAK